MPICWRPPSNALSDDAKKRLEAIESMEELGAGFVLATHDLEIRGAGELLGEQQSGQMTEIGMALYLDLLEEAVKALKEGREPALDKPLAAETEVELRFPAFLPESYIGDVHVRLALYKRIAASGERSGPSTSSPRRSSTASACRRRRRRTCYASPGSNSPRAALGIRRLDLGPQGGYVIFEEKNSINPAAVIRMLQQAPREYRLDGPPKLRISRPMEKEDSALRLRERIC